MKLQNAYDAISDPVKRRAYDISWTGIRDSLRAKRESDRRQAEAAETERKRAAAEKVKKQREDGARQERLQNLQLLKTRYDNDIFEVSRAIRKLTIDLKRLQDQDDEDLRKEKSQNGWWAYLASPIYGKVSETDEQKQARETGRLHRLARKSIKGSELSRKEAESRRLKDGLQDVNRKIAAKKKSAEDEEEAHIKAKARRMEQNARDRALQEMQERIAKAKKEQAERAAKDAREAQAARKAREAQEAQEAQERVRRAAAAENRRREAEERVQAMRAAEEAARSANRTRNSSFSAASGSRKGTCRHDKFWPKVEGKHLCSNCHTVQRRFAFQCPGCNIIACASCRQNLRGEKRKSNSSSRRHGFVDEDDYNADFSYFDHDWIVLFSTEDPEEKEEMQADLWLLNVNDMFVPIHLDRLRTRTFLLNPECH